MANWSTLPREIRDLIYEKLLKQEIRTPDLPFPRGSRKPALCSTDGITLFWTLLYFDNPIHLPFPDLQILSLRRALPTFRPEIDQAISRVQSRSNVWKLDLAIDHRRFFPTWTYLTTRAEHIDRLEVDFRFFHNQRSEDDDPAHDRYINNHLYSPRPFVDALLALLRIFLRRGPDVWRDTTNDVWRESTNVYSIGILAVNILTQKGYIEAENIKGWTKLEVPEDGILCGECLRNVLFSQMKERLPYQNWVEEFVNDRIGEKVDTVTVSIDGQDAKGV